MLRAEAGQLLLFASEEQHALMNVEYSVSLRKCREEDRGRAIVQYRKSDPIFYLEIPRFEVLVDKEELQLFGNGSQRFICNAPSEKAAKNWVRELGAAGCEVSPSAVVARPLPLSFSLAWCGSAAAHCVQPKTDYAIVTVATLCAVPIAQAKASLALLRWHTKAFGRWSVSVCVSSECIKLVRDATPHSNWMLSHGMHAGAAGSLVRLEEEVDI